MPAFFHCLLNESINNYFPPLVIVYQRLCSHQYKNLIIFFAILSQQTWSIVKIKVKANSKMMNGRKRAEKYFYDRKMLHSLLAYILFIREKKTPSSHCKHMCNASEELLRLPSCWAALFRFTSVTCLHSEIYFYTTTSIWDFFNAKNVQPHRHTHLQCIKLAYDGFYDSCRIAFALNFYSF